jgi:Mrp family chromosome partitioning ATPase
MTSSKSCVMVSSAPAGTTKPTLATAHKTAVAQIYFFPSIF